jgi:hypothetical protein
VPVLTRRIERVGRRAVSALLAGGVLALLGAGTAGATPLSVQIGAAARGQALPAGFLGLSIEYPALHAYAGRNPNNVNPVFAGLLRGLRNGSGPVLRIGGDSADQTWWPAPGMVRPAGVTYSLTRNWVAVAHALARATNARYTLDINLAADNAQLAAAEGRALVAGIGRNHITALEIGNEPDLYNVFSWYINAAGVAVKARGRYGMQAYATQLADWRAVLPSVPLVGGALATQAWIPQLSLLRAADPELAGLTVHAYPLRVCGPAPTDSNYVAIANLLADGSSAGLAGDLVPDVQAATALGLPVRLDELNTASCEGEAGVSNSFASALWVLDTLFSLASGGLSGVNIHTLPGAAYAPFSFTETHGRWSGEVNPIYYGMLMFERAFPAGAHLLSVSTPSGPLKVWATQDTSGQMRVILINKDPSQSSDVSLQLPVDSGNLTETWLTAPSVAATTGVTLGGEGFSDPTTTGTLPRNPNLPQVASTGGLYDVTVPAGSAVLLTPAP